MTTVEIYSIAALVVFMFAPLMAIMNRHDAAQTILLVAIFLKLSAVLDAIGW